MNGEPSARLILDAITLRGLGPYLEGTRLEVRPLTILCGKNGSGKSTWLKMLNLLQRSQLRGLLPFAFDRDESARLDVWHDETNSLIKTSDSFRRATRKRNRSTDPSARLGCTSLLHRIASGPRRSYLKSSQTGSIRPRSNSFGMGAVVVAPSSACGWPTRRRRSLTCS